MIVVHEEVKTAVREGKPIVALESAVITAGLPKEPVRSLNARMKNAGWRDDQPVNLELARAMERTVRAGGAIPATVTVIDSRLHIGLDAVDLERLALDANAGKASVTDLAKALTPALSQRERVNAGTTVSGTLATLAALRDSHHTSQASSRLPISVFSTGGIGGVHRDWQKCPDISADLRAIASTPVCVVCSGGKSILDLPATLESLEALNVPVFGYRTHLFPQFQSIGSTDLRVRLKADSADEVARACTTHWGLLKQSGGVLLANPVPEQFAIDAVEMTLAVDAAEREAKKRGVIGALRTPFLLEEIARLTNNQSLEANIALLLNNAQLAAEVAVALNATGASNQDS